MTNSRDEETVTVTIAVLKEFEVAVREHEHAKYEAKRMADAHQAALQVEVKSEQRMLAAARALHMTVVEK